MRSQLLGTLHAGGSRSGCSRYRLPLEISHTSSHVPEQANLPLAKAMVEGLNVATHSINARTSFAAEYSESLEGHSDIRWYCTFNQAKQQQRGFDHMQPWVNDLAANGYVPQTVTKLQTVLQQPGTLRLELSILVDAFDPFVVSCYTLEGDATSLVFQVHSDWQKLIEHVAACRAGTALTLTRAVANEIISREFPHLLAFNASNRVQQLASRMR